MNAKAIIVVSMLLCTSYIPINAGPNDWIIDGDTVYIDDALLYASATPHTVYEISQWVEFELESKVYSGSIDVAWGFDTTTIRPVDAQIWRTVTHNDYDSINGTWNNYTQDEWDNWADDYQHIIWNKFDMTDWYIKSNLPIVKDIRYKVRILLEVVADTDAGKYWFIFKPSSESWAEAYNNNHIYYLDPWYGQITEPYVNRKEYGNTRVYSHQSMCRVNNSDYYAGISNDASWHEDVYTFTVNPANGTVNRVSGSIGGTAHWHASIIHYPGTNKYITCGGDKPYLTSYKIDETNGDITGCSAIDALYDRCDWGVMAWMHSDTFVYVGTPAASDRVFITPFSVHPGTGVITDLGNDYILQDCDRVLNDVARINDTHFLVTTVTAANDAVNTTLFWLKADDSITRITNDKYDCVGAIHPRITYIDTSPYFFAVTWQDGARDGWMRTIDTSPTSITVYDTEEFLPTTEAQYGHSKLCPVGVPATHGLGTYALVYEDAAVATIVTMNITNYAPNWGQIVAACDTYAYGSGDITVMNCIVPVSGNYYVIWDGYGATTMEILSDPGNAAPTSSSPTPANTATGILPRPRVNVTVSDDDGDSMNVTFASNYTGALVTYKHNASCSNGSIVWPEFTGADHFGKKYFWTVYVDDGTDNVSTTYSFTTATLDPPGDFEASFDYWPSPFVTYDNRTSIRVNYTLPSYADIIFIQPNNERTVWSRQNGPLGYNRTGTNTTLNGLHEYTTNRTWYFQGWSWNETYQRFSTFNSSCNKKLEPNNFTVTEFKPPINSSTSSVEISVTPFCSTEGAWTIRWFYWIPYAVYVAPNPGTAKAWFYYCREWGDPWNLSYSTNGWQIADGAHEIPFTFSGLTTGTPYCFRTTVQYTTGDCVAEIQNQYYNITTPDGFDMQTLSNNDCRIGIDVKVWDSDYAIYGDTVTVSLRENVSAAPVWTEFINATGVRCDNATNRGNWTFYDALGYTPTHPYATGRNTRYWYQVFAYDDLNNTFVYGYFTTPSNFPPFRNNTIYVDPALDWCYPAANDSTSSNTSYYMRVYMQDWDDDYLNISMWTNFTGTWTRMKYGIVHNRTSVFGYGMGLEFWHNWNKSANKIWYSVNTTDNTTWANYTFLFGFTANVTGSTGGYGSGIYVPPAEDAPPDDWFWQSPDGFVKVSQSGVAFGDIKIPWGVTLIILFVIALVAIREDKKKRLFKKL